MISFIATKSLISLLQRTPRLRKSILQTQASISGSSYENFSFVIRKDNGPARERLGLLCTPHGNVETPAFVFCATKAAMKSVTPDQIRAEDTQIILSNTYHLMLTPGSELIEAMGGLQNFTAWRGPMLTDSGGYQIFSMGFGSVITLANS